MVSRPDLCGDPDPDPVEIYVPAPQRGAILALGTVSDMRYSIRVLRRLLPSV